MMWLSILSGSVAAGIIQTLTGFGSGIIQITILSQYFNMVAAPAINSAICLVLTSILTWKYRHFLNWKIVLPPSIPYVIASVSLISVVEKINLTLLSLCFGVFLLFISAYFLFFEKKINVKPSLSSALLCGAISGACSGLFGIGGPVIALYFLIIADNHNSYTANIQFLFTATNICNMSARVLRGIYTLELFPATLVGIIGIIAGENIGLKISGRLNQMVMKRVVYIYVGISGIVTIWQNLV